MLRRKHFQLGPEVGPSGSDPVRGGSGPSWETIPLPTLPTSPIATQGLVVQDARFS